ncbi:MAG: ATP-binding protein [Bradyrhizobium sp.]
MGLQQMTEATLSFARQDIAEETRATDLVALIDAVVEDIRAIALDGPARLTFKCRPTALRRAIANLVENAVRYGSRARVSLKVQHDAVEIRVEDDGPGIPPGKLEAVFERSCASSPRATKRPAASGSAWRSCAQPFRRTVARSFSRMAQTAAFVRA